MAMGSYFSKGMDYGRLSELGNDELRKDAEEHIEAFNNIKLLGEKFESDKRKLEDAIDRVEASRVPEDAKQIMIDELNAAIDALEEQYREEVEEEEARVQESLETLLEHMGQTADEVTKEADSLRGVTTEAASIDATSAADLGETQKQELEQMLNEFHNQLRQEIEDAEIQKKNIHTRRSRG